MNATTLFRKRVWPYFCLHWWLCSSPPFRHTISRMVSTDFPGQYQYHSSSTVLFMPTGRICLYPAEKRAEMKAIFVLRTFPSSRCDLCCPSGVNHFFFNSLSRNSLTIVQKLQSNTLIFENQSISQISVASLAATGKGLNLFQREELWGLIKSWPQQ